MNVFVYGTLRPGQGNADIVAHLALDARAARLDGYTMLAGCGGGFPYAVPVNDGVVYSFADSDAAEALTRLDFLEGFDQAEPDSSHYLRIEQEVRFSDGDGDDTTDAFFYVAGPRIDTDGLEAVGRDWIRWRNRRRHVGADHEGEV